MSRRRRGLGSDEPALKFEPEAEASLRTLRGLLLHHHRELVELSRRDYERGHGRVPSGSELVRLLMQDPAFGWLRMLSSLIARLDEVLEEPVAGEAEVLVATAARLILRLEEDDGGFQARYRQALQDSPDVVVSHGRVAGPLRELQESKFPVVPVA